MLAHHNETRLDWQGKTVEEGPQAGSYKKAGPRSSGLRIFEY
jgi:hypothetical protein